VQISRIRLAPGPSDLRSRQAGASNRNRIQAKRLIEILVRDFGVSGAPLSHSACQPAPDPPFRVSSDEVVRLRYWSLVEVAAPSAKQTAEARYCTQRFIRIPLRGSPFVDPLAQALDSFSRRACADIAATALPVKATDCVPQEIERSLGESGDACLGFVYL
jgi:hypothetical protein